MNIHYRMFLQCFSGVVLPFFFFFFFSSRRRHTRWTGDWSSDVCSSDLFSILRNAYLHRRRAAKQEHVVSLEWVGDLAERLPETLPEVEPERLQQALGEIGRASCRERV